MIEENTPQVILAVVITMIILGVGTFAFFIITSEIGYTERQTETFTVTNPAVDQSLELNWLPDSIVSVEQYNGFIWQTVSSTHYTLTGRTLVVDSDGLQG